MRVSLSNLLRWGGRKGVAPEAASKEPAMAQEAQPASPSDRRRSIRWPKTGAASMSWITDDGSWKTMTVWLRDSSDGGAGVMSLKPIPANRSAWLMTRDGEDWQGNIRYCVEAEEGFQVGFERIKVKAAKATPNSAGAQLKWLEKSGKLAHVAVSVRNAGEGRLEAVVSKAVPAPAIVLLTSSEVRCLASTQACYKRGNRFLVEMEVVGDTYRHPVAAHA